MTQELPNLKTPQNTALTPRETDVLRLLAQGNSSQEIANELFVSRRTVEFHLNNIYDKLGVHNRLRALRLATQLGLIGNGSG